MLTLKFLHHYLFSKRAGSLIRTLSKICVIGSGIGMMSLVLVMNVMNGFNRNNKSKLLAVEPRVIIYSNKDKGKEVSELIANLTLDKNVEEVAYFESQDVIVKTVDGLYNGAIAKGIDTAVLWKMLQRIDDAAKEKNFKLQNEQLKLAPKEVIMGYDLARSLGVYEGDELTVLPPESLLLPAGEVPYYEKVVVRYVLTTQIQDIDSKMIFYDRSSYLKRIAMNASREEGLEVRLKDPDNYPMYIEKYLKKGFKSESWRERNSSLFFALKMEKVIMGIFLSLSVLITCFSTITALILLLTQKRKDLGILIALGYTKRKIMFMFTRIGFILSMIGMGSGIFLGLIISLLLDAFPIDVLPDYYYESSIPAVINYDLIGLIFMASVGLSLLGAWLPSYINLRGESAVEIIRKKN